MHCPKCRFECVEEDEYCRQCGAELLSSSTSIVPARTMLPAMLQNVQLPQKVAAGVGAVVLGVGLELLRRGLLTRLTRAPRQVDYTVPALSEIKDLLPPRQNRSQKPPRGYEIHETVVYMRRVIRKAN